MALVVEIQSAWCIAQWGGDPGVPIDREGWLKTDHATSDPPVGFLESKISSRKDNLPLMFYHDLAQKMTQAADIQPKKGQIATIYKSESDRRWLYICNVESKSKTVSYFEIPKKEQIAIVGPIVRTVLVDCNLPIVREVWDATYFDPHRVFLHCWT